MVSFEYMRYLSFYWSEHAKGHAFPTIKRNFADVGEDLLLTVPLPGAFEKEIIPAAMAYFGKWGKFSKTLFANPPKSVIKAAYWMDQWVATVKDTTFDMSAIVAAT